jgi:LPS-assembly protein
MHRKHPDKTRAARQNSAKTRTSCDTRRILFTAILAGLLILRTTAYGSPATPPVQPPWNIIADHVTYNKQTRTYTAQGDVIVTHEKDVMTGDFMIFNELTGKAHAEGHVMITSKGDRSTADKMDLDMNTKTGTLYNGSVFINNNHIYITATEIRKTGENTYTADKATITTCDGDKPDWKFTGRDLDVTIEGYGKIYHATFWADSVPVVYTPFLILPVKTKRQSGLLPPEFALSDRKGFEYNQPLFWAINDNTDATFYNRYMAKRGNMVGAEYRYVLSSNSKGTLMYDTLNDSKVDDGTTENTNKWGYEDSVDRPNSKRYWFRMKQNQEIFGNGTLKVDADVVSDQDYLREFDSMKNGYDASKSYFLTNFGRDIDASDKLVRTNSLLFSKTFSSFNLNAGTYWYDNVVARSQGTQNTTLQKLPEVTLSASRCQIPATPLYYSFQSQYDYFFREDTSASARKGQRADLYPSLILPLRYNNWFSVETTVSLRNTNWYVENETNTPDTLNGSHSRNIYNLSVDLSTSLYRTFNVAIGDVDRIKHTIIPELIYNYTPEKDQTELPYFDAIDRINRVKTLTLALTNTLTSRSPKIMKKDEPTPSLVPIKYNYLQFCRFKIQQVYDINEASEDDPTKFRNKKTREPFEPLYGEIEFLPYHYISFKSDGKWSYYDSRMTQANVSMTLQDQRKDKIIFERRYTRDTVTPSNSVNSLRSYLYLNLNDHFSLYGLNDRDILKHEDIKTSAGVIYNSQCWGLEFDYTHAPGDRRYMMIFSLKGLGDFGDSDNPYKK